MWNRELRFAKNIEDLAKSLNSFLNDPMTVVLENGKIGQIRQIIKRINGLVVEVRSREDGRHKYPHFHLLGNGVDAVFRLPDGKVIEGENTLDSKMLKKVSAWFRESNGCENAIAIWERFHPSR